MLSRVRLFATPWTVARQAPVRGSLQARVPVRVAISSSGDLPDPGIKPTSPESPALQADSFPLSHQGSPNSSTEILMLSVMMLGGGAFGKRLGDEGGSSKGD